MGDRRPSVCGKSLSNHFSAIIALYKIINNTNRPVKLLEEAFLDR